VPAAVLKALTESLGGPAPSHLVYVLVIAR